MLQSVVQILRCIQNLTDIYERAFNENWFSLYSNLRYYQTIGWVKKDNPNGAGHFLTGAIHTKKMSGV